MYDLSGSIDKNVLNIGNIFQVNIRNSNIDITSMSLFVIFHERAPCMFDFPFKERDQREEAN